MATALRVPLEAYQIGHRPTVLRGITLVINVAIVVYLVVSAGTRDAPTPWPGRRTRVRARVFHGRVRPLRPRSWIPSPTQ